VRVGLYTIFCHLNAINRLHAHRTHRQRKHPRHRHTHAHDKTSKRTPPTSVTSKIVLLYVSHIIQLTPQQQSAEPETVPAPRRVHESIILLLPPPNLQCPYYRNTIARLLRNRRPPPPFVFHASWVHGNTIARLAQQTTPPRPYFCTPCTIGAWQYHRTTIAHQTTSPPFVCHVP